jgi:hypothetical protein
VRGPWAYKGATSRRAEETRPRALGVFLGHYRVDRSGNVTARRHCRAARTPELRLLAAAVALAPSGAVEVQHDVEIVGQQQRLDAPAQAAQAQCDYRLAQLRRGGDVAPLVEAHADLNLSSRIGYPRASCERSRAPDACGLWGRM